MAAAEQVEKALTVLVLAVQREDHILEQEAEMVEKVEKLRGI